MISNEHRVATPTLHTMEYFFENNPERSIIIQRGHSEAINNIKHALMSYDENLRQRIHVIAVAPSTYIDDKYAGSVIHLVSTRDFVPWYDFTGRISHHENTVFLTPHKDAPFFDHFYDSPTYRKAIEKQIQHIRNTFIKRKSD